MITIYASELAACIGSNRYRPAEEVAKNVWCRADPEGYRKALIRNDTTDPELIMDTLENLRLTEKAQNIIGSHADSLKNDLGSFVDEHQKDLEAKEIDLKDITSYIHTQRGKILEDDSLQRLERALNVSIRDRNAKFYRRYLDFTVGNGKSEKYVLGGKVDGITEDGYLVEVKNRQYRLFQEMPIYEKVQIHAYMFLTGIVECKFVQSYKGEDVTTLETFDYEFWDDVKQKCTSFVQSIYMLMSDIDLQDAFFATSSMPRVEVKPIND